MVKKTKEFVTCCVSGWQWSRRLKNLLLVVFQAGSGQED